MYGDVRRLLRLDGDKRPEALTPAPFCWGFVVWGWGQSGGAGVVWAWVVGGKGRRRRFGHQTPWLRRCGSGRGGFGGVYWGLSTGRAGGSAALCWGHASRHSSSKHNRACAGEEGHVEIPWAMCYYGHNTTEHPGERGERRCGGGAVRRCGAGVQVGEQPGGRQASGRTGERTAGRRQAGAGGRAVCGGQAGGGRSDRRPAGRPSGRASGRAGGPSGRRGGQASAQAGERAGMRAGKRAGEGGTSERAAGGQEGTAGQAGRQHAEVSVLG